MRYLLLCLQLFQVAFLLLHHWISLPPLNDLKAVRREHSPLAIVIATFVGALFPTIGLAFSLIHWKSGWPDWLYIYLLATYGFLFIGELQAWWIPYLLWPQPKRAASYQVMFANTSAFLPARNGIRINTLHFALHAATFVTVLTLASQFAVGLNRP
jgi:hypothetical protein